MMMVTLVEPRHDRDFKAIVTVPVSTRALKVNGVFPDPDASVRPDCCNVILARRQEGGANTSTVPASTDFVVKLKDGRVLVVEYKGEHLWSNEDSEEKRNLGELWALRSGGKCLFVMPKGKDWQAILNVIALTH